jgi:hypothetical protein
MTVSLGWTRWRSRVVAASPLAILHAIERLAPPVIEFIGEAVEAVKDSPTKRDAARRLIILAAKKTLTG